jgi:hypothetical protein
VDGVLQQEDAVRLGQVLDEGGAAALKDPAKLLSSLDFLGELAIESAVAELPYLNLDQEAKVAMKAMELIKAPKSSSPSSPTESTPANSKP